MFHENLGSEEIVVLFLLGLVGAGIVVSFEAIQEHRNRRNKEREEE